MRVQGAGAARVQSLVSPLAPTPYKWPPQSDNPGAATGHWLVQYFSVVTMRVRVSVRRLNLKVVKIVRKSSSSCTV